MKDGLERFLCNCVLSVVTGPHVFWVEHVLLWQHRDCIEYIVTVCHSQFPRHHHEPAASFFRYDQQHDCKQQMYIMA